MSIFATLRQFAVEYSAIMEHARTGRIVRSLPPEVQKDIGWPTERPTRRTSVRPVKIN